MGTDAHAATIDASISAERQVLGGRYELLGLLGAGGMGNVYRARDLELDETVALKVLRPEVGSAPGALDRFRREVKLARRVTHPNVARVFDIGEHGTDHVLSMEFVDGESLGGRLAREGRLTPARASEIAIAICLGVGAAHDAGVVHRDLKPDNVLLGKDGRVLVTDFGIARALATDGRTAGIVGTPAYMAPEQIDERGSIDHRADIYAFGAMLYEMLTGELAWKGDSVWAVAGARLIKPPPDPRAVRPELPPALCALVLRCMAREPAERFASMHEVVAALRGLHLPDATTPVPSASPGFFTQDRSAKRVAVLPFSNLGPAEEEYVADGITEDLIDLLSVAEGLQLRSRGVVMRFKGATRDPREVGRELDVHVVVEGSVRRGKGSFRVNTRLVSVVDGLQLWARRFDVPEAELLAHNDIIAQAVAEALGVAVAAPERSPADSKAVELYLRARDAYHRVFSGDVNAVLKCFDDALAHSPNDPRLLAGRAMTGAMRWVWDPKSRAENESFADRVLKLAPSLAEAHAARGTFLFYDGQRTASVVPLRRALMLSPNNFDAHVCLGRLMHEADHPAGRRHLETAAALDPSSELPRVNWAADLALHGQWDAAYEASSLLRGNRKVPMLLVQSRLVIWEGDVERARRLLPLIDPNDPRESVVVGWLRVVLDKVAPPPMQLPPRPVLAPTMRDFFDEVVCEIACSLGDVPTALAALARLDEADAQPRAWLERAPPLALIRDMPEVQPIRERIAARAARTVTEYEREL